MPRHNILLATADRLALVRGNGRSAQLREARQVRRGVYCTDRERAASFDESVVAALLVLPAGCAAAGVTAARLWRLDGLVPPHVDEPLEFLVPGFKNSVRLAGCTLHFDAVTALAFPYGIPATALARTLIDVAARGTFIEGVTVVEAALQRTPRLRSELERERARRLPRRGRALVERVLDFASPLSESVLESHARVLWAEADLPPPVQQAVLRLDGRFLARVDFLWPAQRLVVEVDGLAKYADRGALQKEKVRQNDVVAAGYTILRFTWYDIEHRPDTVVRQVRSALRRASA